MWHTAEMIKIFEKMTEGYDIYRNRNCVSHYAMIYLLIIQVEKNIMKMLLGWAWRGYKGSPI